ncbi:hypothetical protein [Streptomyces sp. NPDC002785]|uniref:hypothetical protein n=1 Tax=Streptomyces sp. NPDC002785 TaxID=3154543 RepID=UPI0033301F20
MENRNSANTVLRYGKGGALTGLDMNERFDLLVSVSSATAVTVSISPPITTPTKVRLRSSERSSSGRRVRRSIRW